MKIREVMTGDVGYCQPNSALTDAAMIMWQRDCGAVPIVDEQNQVVGMITDRDICIATAMQNRLASEIRVGEIISGNVKTCRPNDDLENALKTMKRNQLRRLPVTNENGTLLGIVSISDLLSAGKNKDFKKKLFAALREISSFRPVQLHEISVEAAGESGEDSGDLHFIETDNTGDNQFENDIDEKLSA